MATLRRHTKQDHYQHQQEQKQHPHLCLACMVFISCLISILFLVSFGSWNTAGAAAMSSIITKACTAVAQHPIGLGTMMIDRAVMKESLRSAIVDAGYRRIDCAPVYFNEDAVGDALHDILLEQEQQSAAAKSKIQRSDLFIVSKLASPYHRKEHVELALRKTLKDLRLDYLDLYLVHWPVAFQYVPIEDHENDTHPERRGWKDEAIDDSDNGNQIDDSVSIHETWHAMELLVDKGLVKFIGVSNFPVILLHELLTQAKIPPAVNQCESHPYLNQDKLLKYCNSRDIHFQAYSPLGTPGYARELSPDEPVLLNDPVLLDIALKHNATPSQIALKWAIQRGTSVVVKSATPQHQLENMQAVASSSIRDLTDSDRHQINQLGTKQYRYFRPEEWWGEKAMAVFD